MPIPPPAFLFFMGPKAGIVAKAVAYEYLPAVSSATLAAVLSRLAWRRLPDWIKEDVSFRKKGSTTSDVERLSSILEKIQAWIVGASKQLDPPVPYPNAAFLIYWQLVAQQQRKMQSINQELRRQSLLLKENGENGTAVVAAFTEETLPVAATAVGTETATSNTVDYQRLHEMLALANLAYYVDDESYLREQLQMLEYDLDTCFVPTRPGSVGYFIAEQEQQSAASTTELKTLLIGVRGTASLEELLTDACGRSVSYYGPDGNEEGISNSIRIEVSAPETDEVILESQNSSEELEVEIVSGHERIWVEQDGDNGVESVNEGGTESHIAGNRHLKRRVSSLDSHVRCHEGILLSGRRLYAQVRPIIEECVVVQGTHRLLLVGHSLGASACALLAMMLRTKYPELVNSGRLQVYSFGPPPVLDHDTAIGASSYVTSIVNQSDLIARCSLNNLSEFLEVLRTISSDILIPNGLAPTGPRTTAAFLQQLSAGDKGDPFWSPEKLQEVMSVAQSRVQVRKPDHLYVPGKVYYLESTHNILFDDDDGLQNPNKEVEGQTYSCTLTDGTAPRLREIEMNGCRMLGDHTTASYEAAIGALLLDQQTAANATLRTSSID